MSSGESDNISNANNLNNNNNNNSTNTACTTDVHGQGGGGGGGRASLKCCSQQFPAHPYLTIKAMATPVMSGSTTTTTTTTTMTTKNTTTKTMAAARRTPEAAAPPLPPLEPSHTLTINNKPVILLPPMDIPNLPTHNSNRIVDKTRDYFLKVISRQSGEVALIPVAEIVVTINDKFRPIIKHEGANLEMINNSGPLRVVHSLKVLKRNLLFDQPAWWTCSKYAEVFAKAATVDIMFRDGRVVPISQAHLQEFPFPLQHLLLRNGLPISNRDVFSTTLECTFAVFQEYLYFSQYRDFGFYLEDNQIIELAELAALTDNLKMQVRCLEKFYNNNFPYHLCNRNVADLPAVFIHVIWNFLCKQITFDDDMNQLAASLRELQAN